MDAFLRGRWVYSQIAVLSQLGSLLIFTVCVWDLTVYSSGGSDPPSPQNRQLGRELPWIKLLLVQNTQDSLD